MKDLNENEICFQFEKYKPLIKEIYSNFANEFIHNMNKLNGIPTQAARAIIYTFIVSFSGDVIKGYLLDNIKSGKEDKFLDELFTLIREKAKDNISEEINKIKH